jgi:hypothetical protein
MAFLDIARGAAKGFAEAAGNQDAANDLQKQQDDAKAAKAQKLKMQIAPLSLAAHGIQAQLAPLIDPATGKPRAGQEDRFNDLQDQLSDIIQKQRMILHPPPREDPHGLGYLIHTATDKAHITKHAVQTARAAQSAKVNAYYDQNRAAGAQGAATATQAVVPGQLSPTEERQAALVKAGIEPKAVDKPVLKQYKLADGTVAWLDASHPENLPAGASALEPGAAKTAPTVKPLESGGVPYGVEADGKTYLASQMTDPATPQNVKDTWKTIQDAKAAKQAEEDKKEADRDKRFLETQAAIAGRMGQSEAFQAQMADYREGLGVYKGLDAQARKTQELADTYSAQYAQPGNHSATDTALLTDYTSVLAAGGRKTQAEINLARNIGNFKLNWEQRLKKLRTGELPDELRKMYLDYISSAAKTQRDDADKAKPDLPQVGRGFEGPKTKSLKGGGDDIDAIVNALSKGQNASATQP